MQRNWSAYRIASDRRSGLTIIEVLVAIGIAGLLVAILIPAVQHSRSAAQLVTCKNNLKQFGVAIASHAEAHQTYPTALDKRPERGYLRLLPYLEAPGLRETLLAGETPDSYFVPSLVCPADPVVMRNMPRGDASYFYSIGSELYNGGDSNGFCKSRYQDLSPRDITDGASQTAAASERLVRPFVDGFPSTESMEAEPRRFFWWTKKGYWSKGEEDLAVQSCKTERTTVIGQFSGVNMLGLIFGGGYDHILTPNQPGCYNQPESMNVQPQFTLTPASSNHPGGAASLFVDGSVHFIAETIDAMVWRALGSRNGAEKAPFES